MRFGSRWSQPVANVSGAAADAPGFGIASSGDSMSVSASAADRVVGRRGGRGWEMRPSVGGVVSVWGVVSVCGRVV